MHKRRVNSMIVLEFGQVFEILFCKLIDRLTKSYLYVYYITFYHQSSIKFPCGHIPALPDARMMHIQDGHCVSA